jgi:photosystem II stability/assembly factor-like uncharacterized protein
MQKSDLFAQWYQQKNSTGLLNSVFFPTRDTGYAVGDGGMIMKTTNEGTNWTVQTSGTTNYLTSVYFTDSKTGYAVGWGIILKTTDGGNTWIKTVTQYTIFQCSSVFFPSKNIGYVLNGGDGDLYNFKTRDAGNTWDTISYATLTTDGALGSSVFFTDTLTGYVAGGSNIWKTIDGGITWSNKDGDGPGIFGNAVYFPSKDTGYVVSAAYGMTSIRTNNAGASWIKDTCEARTTLLSLYFTNDSTGYVVGGSLINGSPGIILKTSDGGNTWNPQKIETYSGYFTSVYFTTPDTGYAVGAGQIFRTTNAGGPVIKDTSVVAGTYNIIQENSVQIYPNPTSNHLTINNKQCTNQQIDIYDVLGKEILREPKCNNPITEIDVSRFVDGIYFVKIYSDNNLYGVFKFIKEN